MNLFNTVFTSLLTVERTDNLRTGLAEALLVLTRQTVTSGSVLFSNVSSSSSHFSFNVTLHLIEYLSQFIKRIVCNGACACACLHANLTLYSAQAKYSATSYDRKLVDWPLMGGLLHLVQRGEDWAAPQPTQASPVCIKCNSPPINGQCTNHRIAVQWSVALRFQYAHKGLT